MKIIHLSFSYLLCFICFTATAQENADYKWEVGLDMTPIIALPYANSSNQPGLEFSVRRKVSERGKLRFRYFNHREDNPALHDDGFIFGRSSIEPSADGTPRSIVNVNYQEVNNGISLGYQRDFSVNGLRLYVAVDLHGQISEAEVWSEVLLEGEVPFPARSAYVFNAPAFGGVINNYNNYQVGVVPALGVDIPIGERINFSIEFGARIAYFQHDLPQVKEFEQVDYVRGSGMIVEANPIKDLIIAFRF